MKRQDKFLYSMAVTVVGAMSNVFGAEKDAAVGFRNDGV
jgi:hypothetical protein